MKDFESKKISKQESTTVQIDEIEALSQYAQEHYKQYTAFNSEVVALLNRIDENYEKFQSDILPNASTELTSRITAFIDGVRDENIITLLERSNFDYESLLDTEEDEQIKAQTLLEAILKAQSYDEAVKQNRNEEIDFPGFEEDPDIPDIKEFVYKVFGTELLQRCLISRIKCASSIVNIKINGTNYWIPVDVYEKWKAHMPEVKKIKFRAESFVKWNTDPNFSKKFIPTPIYFYSFHGEQPEQLDYLNDTPAEQKMRLYKLGTVAHEIAHHVYNYLMSTNKRAQWQELVDKTQAVTDYAKSYADSELRYEEFFTEAVRLKTTAPDYLETSFPEIDQFLENNFPSIKNDDKK